MPWSDIYELYTERLMIEKMEAVARKWHEGQFRKDGKTPYIAHPAKVAALLSEWGFGPECDGWAIAVAWAHDLLEETPAEKRAEVEADIFVAGNGLLHEGEKVLEAVRLLTRDKQEFPDKADYIRNVAAKASYPVLAVKIADRLCNTRDFLELAGAGRPKALKYFTAGEPLFAALDRHGIGEDNPLRASIAALRKELLA